MQNQSSDPGHRQQHQHHRESLRVCVAYFEDQGNEHSEYVCTDGHCWSHNTGGRTCTCAHKEIYILPVYTQGVKAIMYLCIQHSMVKFSIQHIHRNLFQKYSAPFISHFQPSKKDNTRKHCHTENNCQPQLVLFLFSLHFGGDLVSEKSR